MKINSMREISIGRLRARSIFHNKNRLKYKTIIEVSTHQKFENLKLELNNIKKSLFNFVNSGDDKINIKYNDKNKFNSIINKYF
tara:strand:- start:23 stop:274 length:252 start_codon:yes stop_codon:yes gene_type:complete